MGAAQKLQMKGLQDEAERVFTVNAKMLLYFKKIFLMFVYFWDNVRDRVQAVEGQTEGDTESEVGSRLWAVSPEPDTGLKLTNREIMTWAKVGHSTDWATQAPQDFSFLK